MNIQIKDIKEAKNWNWFYLILGYKCSHCGIFYKSKKEALNCCDEKFYLVLESGAIIKNINNNLEFFDRYISYR